MSVDPGLSQDMPPEANKLPGRLTHVSGDKESGELALGSEGIYFLGAQTGRQLICMWNDVRVVVFPNQGANQGSMSLTSSDGLPREVVLGGSYPEREGFAQGVADRAACAVSFAGKVIQAGDHGGDARLRWQVDHVDARGNREAGFLGSAEGTDDAAEFIGVESIPLGPWNDFEHVTIARPAPTTITLSLVSPRAGMQHFILYGGEHEARMMAGQLAVATGQDVSLNGEPLTPERAAQDLPLLLALRPSVGSAPQPIGQMSGGVHTAQGTNVFAVLSLIFAFIFWPLGLIFGHIARSQVKRTGEGGAGLALAGLIISYCALVFLLVVVVAVAGISSSSGG
jgi:hypothetical protein